MLWYVEKNPVFDASFDMYYNIIFAGGDAIAEPLYALIGEVFDMRGVFKILRKVSSVFLDYHFSIWDKYIKYNFVSALNSANSSSNLSFIEDGLLHHAN